MPASDPDTTSPKAFISYSGDDDAHTKWVERFATRLRNDGVDVTLDLWNAVPGEQVPAFVERAVGENDIVIIVCTPRYKERSEGRGVGVGYESNIITAQVFKQGNERKFIPVLRRGTWDEAAPDWLLGKVHVDLSADLESAYQDLLRTLHDARDQPPPLGFRPNFVDSEWSPKSSAYVWVNLFAGSSTPQHQSSATTTRTDTEDRDPDVDSDIRSLVAEVVDDPDTWLDTPNDQLGGERPRDFIGTNREQRLRELARSIKIGMFT